MSAKPQVAPVSEPFVGDVLKVIGLMSGTSMDGIDAAYLETDGADYVRAGKSVSVPFSDSFRKRLIEFVARVPERDAPEADAIEQEMTDLHATAVTQLAAETCTPLRELDLVGFHGQTVWHRPERRDTWQMGDGARLAKTLGVPVVFDFRSDDVRAGGQGAPLLPVYHAALAGDLPTAVLNIGGVANVTWIDRKTDALVGFDTGPGNGLIDDWVRARLRMAMDEDGAVAARGKVHRDLVDLLMEHAYFAQTPPKSLDRFAFTAHRLSHLSDEDGAATLTAFTAASAAQSLCHCPQRPQKIFVAGGGRRNPTLMKLLAEYSGVAVVSVDELGWDGDALEAQGFAYLAARVMRGLPLTFPGTTGIAAPATGGRVATPRGLRKSA